MSEAEQELSIVKFFTPELEMVCEALVYKINHKTWTQSEEEERRKYEDLAAKLQAGVFVTTINEGKQR